ncbi:MAG: DUF1697 domain-containing protein [Gemmatimonadaceae bacterium]
MTHVAFIRAINVRGHTTVAMRDLMDAFVAAGCTNVRSVIQSGNIVLTPPIGPKTFALDNVRRRVQSEIGSDLVIVFKTIKQLERLVKADPFRGYTGKRGLKLYVAFLTKRPRGDVALPVRSAKEHLEAIAIAGRDVFIVSARKPSGFYGFPNNFIEAELGVLATTRNWSTITKIVSLVGDVQPVA